MSIHLSNLYTQKAKPLRLPAVYTCGDVCGSKSVKEEGKTKENGKLCNFQPFTINFLLFATAVIIVVVDGALCVRTPHFLYTDFYAEV
jgi:hypothetical protein